MHVHQLKKAIEEIANPALQEEWDNSGVQICYAPKDIKKVLVCLDVNSFVVEEAIKEGADFILSHHPLFFEGVKSIHGCHPEGANIINLIQNKIYVYSAHTSFDKCIGGNNDYLLAGIGCTDIRGIYGSPEDICKLGTLKRSVSFGDFAARLNKFLRHPGGIKLCGDEKTVIKTVGVCTGAGAEFAAEAYDLGADVFISGDIKHHQALASMQSGKCLIDAGHFGTEWLFIPNMASKLREKLGSKVEIIESKAKQNPFNKVL